jgi:hypothetical protein
MYGRHLGQDLGRPALDAQTKFGAATEYTTRGHYRLAPQYLHASNRPGETFIGNIPVRIVVAQLPGQTTPNNLRQVLSLPVHLRPGNQSLGGT